MINEQEPKESSLFSESRESSQASSLHFNIKKQEELMRQRIKSPEFQNEIEEIGIRELFIKDAVKLTYEQRRAQKDTY